MPTDEKPTRSRKPIPHEEVLNKLPADERAEIKKGAKKLIEDYRRQLLREADKN